MTDIVLSTITARYSHASFGLRWLRANSGIWREKIVIKEFHLKQAVPIIAESILKEKPKIIGLGVYIWNLNEITELVQIIKQVAPEIIIIIGGPEVSYEYEELPVFHWSDYLVRGEGERAFSELLDNLLTDRKPQQKIWEKPISDLNILTLPYDEYTSEDIEHKIIYVESTRGCPFHCEFCLSSVNPGVRFFDRGTFLESMYKLIERGAKNFTFVDRTFNINETHALDIIDFFLSHIKPDMRIHFEIVPDKLSMNILERFKEFPSGTLHLETGLQTTNPITQDLISRRQNLEKTFEVLRYLRTETGAKIHADLVAGMPAETWDTMRDSFNRLIEVDPQEIQLGILKRLRGAPISRHIKTYSLAFAPFPPYEILQTSTLSFDELQKLKRMARYLELYYNQGNFQQSLNLLWASDTTPFDAFSKFSDFIWEKTGKTHELSLATLANLLFSYLMSTEKYSKIEIESALRNDYSKKPGRTERLNFHKTIEFMDKGKK
ncbi:MAG TPA: DUF4080 domain-containing protein [Candidatus Hydrogenedens sp.]|nr:DUF4080 domain-containing protein [Candidatus Hydrogenedens sp.]